MNLHALVSPVISVVNPMTTCQWYQSAGSVKNADFSNSPTYKAPVDMQVQQQALSQKDLQHMAMLNIQGVATKFWLSGASYGINRITQQGGDKFVDAKEQTWLVQAVMEIWPDWCSVIAVLQVTP